MASTPNTLTNLIPDLYNALDVVSRELVGFIPAVTSDMTHERAAVGQTVRSPVAPAASASDIAPDVTPPDDGEQVIGNVTMTISKARRVPIRWNGEEKRGLDNNGASFNVIFRDQVAQAMRTLVNEIESDLAALYTKASRAQGAANAIPFTSNLADAAQLRKILSDNGGWGGDMQLVLDTSAGASMRTLGQLSKANEASDDSLLRRGVLLDVHGFAVRESGQAKTHTAGAMSSATTSSAALSVGQTVIPLATAGTGVVAPGDVISIANDANKYVVAAVSFAGSNPASGDTITIGAPGIRMAQGAAARNITVLGTSTRAMAFSRSAIALATRAPALPQQGDSARDRMVVTDAVSGLSFEISMYPQYRQMQYEVALAWGVAAVKPAHIGLLVGQP